jgi:Zn-finger nucleic acid-binding protein
MEVETFAGHLGGQVELDICYPCNAIWFDRMESVQLAPVSIMRLFRMIHEHRDGARRPLADKLRCIRCASILAQVQDIGRGGRFSYHRCSHGHGRLTTFFQFLREKQFVRDLSAAELNEFRVKVVQVRCSSCGGAIDLARDTACPYCRSPISVLDAGAVEKTLRDLADKQHVTINQSSLADAVLAVHRRHEEQRRLGQTRNWGAEQPDPGWIDAGDAVDLVADCISVVAGFFD